MRVELQNDFHNTVCFLNLSEKNKTVFQGREAYVLSDYQRRKVKNLCGVDGCCCGVIRGHLDEFGRRVSPWSMASIWHNTWVLIYQ